MTTAPAQEVRNQLEERALEYLDLKEQLKSLNNELQEVSERTETLQQRLGEGETNIYVHRCRELECEIYYTKSGIVSAAIEIDVLRTRLRVLTGKYIHFWPSFE